VIRHLLLPIAASILLSGCATSYQSFGATGGHAEHKAPGKLEHVTFLANGFTSPSVAQHYAMYRCAELAKAKSKPYFMMYNSLVAAALDRPARMPRVGSAQVQTHATTFLLLLDEPRPGAHNTAEVLAELKPVVQSGRVGT
jgi:hypothetical protein